MDVPMITKEIYISSISIDPGEYLTIYANGKTIEVRVTPTGKIEIYSDDVKAVVPFSEWYSIS